MKEDLLPLELLLAEPDLPPGREAVLRFEAAVANMPQVELPLRHFFVKGVYVKEITIPKDHVLTSYIHTQDCVSTMAKGKMLVSDGMQTVVMTAPCTFVCLAGSKKAGISLEDTVWLDSYANPDDEQDLDVLLTRYTAKSHQEYLTRVNLLLEKKPCLQLW